MQARNFQHHLPIMIMMVFSISIIVREGGDILYRNAGKGVFEDVTSKANIGTKPVVLKLCSSIWTMTETLTYLKQDQIQT